MYSRYLTPWSSDGAGTSAMVPTLPAELVGACFLRGIFTSESQDAIGSIIMVSLDQDLATIEAILSRPTAGR